MTASEETAPLSALQRLVEQARQVDRVEVTAVSGDDPLQRLRGLIDRAKEDEESAGGASLRRLKERIEEARQLPEPAEYRRPDGDPLQALQARMRGELPAPEALSQPAPPLDAVHEPDAGAGADTGAEARQRVLGSALEQSLQGRSLPGPVRAEVAARLAVLMKTVPSDELEAIWELVVFAQSELGSNGGEK